MKKAKKTIQIAVITVVILIIAILAVILVSRNNKKPQEGTLSKMWSYSCDSTNSVVSAGYNSLSREIAVFKNKAEEIKEKRAAMFVHDVPLNPDYEIMTINFEEIWQTNDEAIGYIDFESPDLDIISYPVYYRPSSHYYLDHNAAGATSVYGEIYVEPGILNGHSRTNTILYGHDMRNGSMFGSLDNYTDASYYEGHEFFWYYTPNGKYRYQIYSVHPTPYDGYAFSWFKEPGDAFTEYLTKSKADASYETGVTPENDDEIITLCTCTGSSDIRLVVHARLIYRDETISETATTETVTTEAVVNE